MLISSSNNETNTTIFERTKQFDWIFTLLVAITLIVIGLGLIVSLIHYGITTKKWRAIQRNNEEKLNGGAVYTSMILCATLCVCYYISALVYLNIGHTDHSNEICNIVDDILKTLYALVIFAVNLFLWIRQRIFYTNCMLNMNMNKFIRACSFVSIFVIFFGGLFGLVFANLPYNSYSTVEGCTYLRDEKKINSIVLSISVSFLTFGQFSLVGLFAYILIKNSQGNKTVWIPLCCKTHETNGRKKEISLATTISADEVSTRSHASSTPNKTSALMIKRIIKFTTVCSLLSVLTDTVVLVFTFYIWPPQYQRRIPVLAALFGVSFNFIFILLSFLKWKKMIFSLCRKK